MQPRSASATSVIIFSFVLYCTVRAAPNDGKYNPKKYGKNGKYVHTIGDGDYVEDLRRYRYVHYDDGDRGRYFHIHIPYDGGYGNYEGGHEPYRFTPYDPAGEYAELISKYSSDPFGANSYDVGKPSVYLEYGVPAVSESNTASSTVDVRKSLLPGPGTAYLPIPEPGLDVRKSLLPGLGTAYLPVLTPVEQKLATGSSETNTKIVPRTNSLDSEGVSSRKKGSYGNADEAITSANLDDSPPTTANSPRTADAGADSLHNHPCFAVSGTLKLSKT